MSEGYMPGMTIDRIDNSNGYQPGNCRWIPRSEQNKNRRSTIYVDTPRGRMTVTEAASAAGISWFAMRNRVMKGWPIEKILSPSQGK
jgi:hypothetical protein